MKITLTSDATVEGASYLAGSVLDLTDRVAFKLIARGLAKAGEEKPKKRSKVNAD